MPNFKNLTQPLIAIDLEDGRDAVVRDPNPDLKNAVMISRIGDALYVTLSSGGGECRHFRVGDARIQEQMAQAG